MSEKNINEQTLEFLSQASKKNLENVNEKKVLISQEQVKKLHELREMQREKGEWSGGPVPFGYHTEKRTLKIHPVEYNSIRQIFKWMKGTGITKPKDVHKFIKEEEIPNKRGVVIPRPSVYRLFEPERIEIYLGDKYGLKIFDREEIPDLILAHYDIWRKQNNKNS